MKKYELNCFNCNGTTFTVDEIDDEGTIDGLTLYFSTPVNVCMACKSHWFTGKQEKKRIKNLVRAYNRELELKDSIKTAREELDNIQRGTNSAKCLEGLSGNNVVVNFKKVHPNATIPKYTFNGDAGLDLKAVTRILDINSPYIEYGTGLTAEIPQGYVGLLFPRSSVSDRNMSMANSVGVIDSNYRGEIKLRFYLYDEARTYTIGDRVGQLLIVPCPRVNVKEIETLTPTDRGIGGFGSSGN